MKENFFTSMLSEGGKVSHKRFISVLFSIFEVWAGIYIVTHYEKYALTAFGYILISIGVLTGVTTVPQIVGLFRGTPTKDEPPAPTTTTTTTTATETKTE